MDLKEIWSNEDFEEMGWHDGRLYSLAVPTEDFKLVFDIDYIFEWDKSGDISKGFWISPCDLTFFDVVDFKVSMDFQNNMLLFISDIKRSNRRPIPNGKFTKWDYEIECDNGVISFSFTGFEQRVRKQPVLSETQDLDKAR